MFTRDRLRNVLRTIGIMMMVLAFLPHFQFTGGQITKEMLPHLENQPNDRPFIKEFGLGWQKSPLIYYRHEFRLIAENDTVQVKDSSSVRFELISWSFFTLIAGILLEWLARKVIPGPSSSASDASI